MSRDFELLQRVEQERKYQPLALDPAVSAVRMPKAKAAPEIAQEQTAVATQPSVHLAPAVRNELTKLVLRTFLATPAIKVIMFTGVEAQEGAKWIAACTADVLSGATRGRVCLVDADLEFPTLHRYFSLPNEEGLAGMLGRSCSVTRATRRIGENLWIVSAGTQPSDLHMTAAMFQKAIVDLLDNFDYMVIAAPDCNRSAEVSAIGAAAESAVLVLDAVSTRRVAAQHAKVILEIAKVRILGSVFNNRSFPVPDFLYSRL